MARRALALAPEDYRIKELAARSADGRVLEIRIQKKLRSPNEVLGRHWREKNNERKSWQMHISNAVILSLGAKAALELLSGEAPLVGCHGSCTERRRVSLVRYVPHRRNFIRDDDNLPFTAKPVLDALKHLGLIKDDKREWCEYGGVTQEVSNDGTFWTWIRIEPAAGTVTLLKATPATTPTSLQISASCEILSTEPVLCPLCQVMTEPSVVHRCGILKEQ